MAKRRKSKKPIIISISAIVLAIISVVITYFPGKVFPTWSSIYRSAGINETPSTETYPFMVHYIDVGEADCELITSDGDTILIDTGDVDSYLKIDSYLKSLDISHIDYLILTHAHADHIGSASEIIENYKIDNIIMPRYSEDNMPDTDLYANLLKTISIKGVNAYAANPGDYYNLNGCSFSVLAPNGNYTEINNSSVVIKTVYKNKSFLFMGDAEKKSEKDALKNGMDISSDVIKLGHHGSSTSSSEALLKAVNPTFAVISCGINNQYNFPSDSTLQELDKLGISYKRTDVSGTIIIGTDGNNLYLSTEK